MLDLAVIGAGAIAQQAYLPAIQELPTARLHAVVDVNEDRAEEIAERFDASKAITDDRSLVGSVDAVVIATPPRFHADISERFLREGVHVLTEKPIATDSRRGQELIDLSRERGTHYAISRQLRESPACGIVKKFCEKGAIGDLEKVSIRYGGETHWEFASDYRVRKDLAWGGVLTDKAPHALDLLRWMFGTDARVDRYRDDSLGGLEANAEVELTFSGKTDVRLEATADRDLQNELLVRGEHGMLRADPKTGRACHIDEAGQETILSSTTGVRLGEFLPRVAKQLERFVDAVSEATASYVPAEEGLEVLTWIESCYDQRESLEYPWEQRPLEGPTLVA